ncbi:MAG: n-(5-phosphoribosyl)anthranilate isomerase [Phycisphaerales bacterium]|nr:n-(5-phosphoribosyl)anthranilate isomerase [Phycisphaerales bacterium]
MLIPRVKICCIATAAEAAAAVRGGAAAVGLVSAMPSGPGPIDEALIAAIVPAVPPGVATFLLTSQTAADAIVAQQRRTGCDTLQLCDAVPADALRAVRAELPGVRLVQVVHVLDDAAVDEARAAEPLVDAILLDSGNPRLAVKQLGGTGRRHDWAVSRRVVEAVEVPVWLAGGLTPANVAEAVATVRPHGLDVCSGVRTDGRLDEAKLAALFGALPSA